MDLFEYRDGQLYCEQVPVAQIAQQLGTPTYIYSAGTFVQHYQRLVQAFAALQPTVCYSVKCNSNIHICRLLAQQGSGFDVVSGGELFRAVQAGGDPAKMAFSGVGKTDDEISQAIDAGLGLFSIESLQELENVQQIAASRKTVVNAALRINPDVDPKTHRYITTGKRENKFGVDIARAEDIFLKHHQHQYLKLRGIHLHIGSQITSAGPYTEAIAKVLELADRLAAKGVRIDTLDLGGGFGADYHTDQAPLSADFADKIVPLLKDRQMKLFMEPGRTIAANGGILVARVLYVKPSGDKTFIVVDAAMNDLIRPMLYQAFHFIWPVKPVDDLTPPRRAEQLDLPGLEKYDVVGPICETDCFAYGRMLPRLKRGDLVAIFAAGAYGFTMASQYNSRPRAAEVLVQDGLTKLIRRRETYQDLIAAEVSISYDTDSLK